MVDKELLKEIKKIIEAGPENADPMDTLKIYELFKQISKENEDLKDAMEDMDIKVQMIITDIDKKFWVSVSEGEFNYGEGAIEGASFTLSTTKEVGSSLLFGQTDATSAYMAGDITVEGNLQDAMAYQEIIELCTEAFEDLTEDL